MPKQQTNRHYTLSIIVTAYNVEDYVEECLLSIFEQKYNPNDIKVEVIIVNDGSVDDTKKIIDKIIQEYSNAIQIYKDNEGASVARNVGVKHSSGDYLWFIDGDDRMKPDSIMKLSKILEESHDVDIFKIKNCILEKKDGIWSTSGSFGVRTSLIGKNLSGEKCFSLFLLGQFGYAPWSCIINSRIIKENSIYFTPGIYFQDMEILGRLLVVSKKIHFMGDVMYEYRIRDGSITHSCNQNHIFSLFISIDKVLELFPSKNSNKQMQTFQVFYWFQILRNLSKRKESLTPELLSIFIDKLSTSLQKNRHRKLGNQNLYVKGQLIEILEIFEGLEFDTSQICEDFCSLTNFPKKGDKEYFKLSKKVNSKFYKLLERLGLLN